MLRRDCEAGPDPDTGVCSAVESPNVSGGGGATDNCVFVCTVDFAVMCCVLSVGAVKYAVRRSGARCGAAVCLAALGREQC